MNQSNTIEGGSRLKISNTSNIEVPRLTIITVILNPGAHLIPLIENVLSIKGDNVEFIIVDGGSKDGTLDILRSYDSGIDYWISERDHGIYDAMNKGVALAKGSFIYHLNVGDKLLQLPSILFNDLSDDISIVAGRVQRISGSVHIPSSGMGLLFHNTLHHQGCFYRNSTNIQYDFRYRVFADFDLNQKILKSGGRVVICDEVIASHDQTGISHSTNRFNEVFQIIKKNHGIFWVVISYFYFKLRGLLQRVF